MKITSFLKLVEIQTKVASMIPLAIGTLFSLVYFEAFRWEAFLLMLVSLLAFDMFTTALNNYMDYKRAKLKEGYGYEVHNSIVRDQLSPGQVKRVLVSLLLVGILAGIFLVLVTNPLVLLLGMASFAVGILYSYGPLPISRTPLGELFSGGFMGTVLIGVSVLIHQAPSVFVQATYTNGHLLMTLELRAILAVLLIGLPATMGIAGIMLANNICDIKEDISNHRYTLAVLLGKRKAEILLFILYGLAFLSLLLTVVLGILGPGYLGLLLLALPIFNLLKAFSLAPSKQYTFANCVKSFVLLNGTLVVFLLVDFIAF